MNIRRNLWSASFASLFLISLCSCGAPSPPLPPSLELAKPVTDLRVSRKGNRVFLTWTVPSQTTDFALVRHLGQTRICRGAQPDTNRCGTIASEIQPPQPIAKSVRGRKKPDIKAVNASATDVLPADMQQQDPAGFVNYAVETLNTHGRSAGLSNVVPIPLAPTLAPPTDLAAKVGEQGVTLTWTASQVPSEVPQLSYEYRIYRRQEATAADAVAGEVPLGNTAEITFLDPGAAWQVRYQYRVTPVTVISGQPASVQVEGDDSAPTTVFVNDVYPPSIPSGLQAVASGVGQLPFVELTWSPVTAADLAGYNVYRREEGGEAVKINSDLVKSPSFRDVHVENGKTYSYSITAMDLRNNESARSEEISERLP